MFTNHEKIKDSFKQRHLTALAENGEAASNVVYRCPSCGYYDQKDMQLFRSLYERYKESWQTPLGCLLLFGIGVIVVAAIMAYDEKLSFSDFIKKGLLMRLALINLGLILLAIIYWFVKLRNLKDKFEQKLIELNGPKISRQWLVEWKNRFPELAEKFNKAESIEKKISFWKKIERIQHRYAPISAKKQKEYFKEINSLKK